MASNGSGLSACVLFAFFDIARTIYGSSSGRGKGYFSVCALRDIVKKVLNIVMTISGLEIWIDYTE